MNYFKFMLISVIALFVMSCDKNDDTPGLSINDFKGSWTATSATYTSNINSADQLEIISNGASIDFTMLEEGKTRTWFTFGAFHDEWDATVTIIDDSTFMSTPVEIARGVKIMSFNLENNILTLTNEVDSFDFTLMNEPLTSATSVIVLTPN